MEDRIGFMQGRLSPVVNGLIQSFPWNNWREEMEEAARLGLHVLEWTLDHENLYANPLMTSTGQDEISKIMRELNLSIPSLTGDCFMQAPFWKVFGAEREARQRDFIAIMEACSIIGISQIVVPLVDDGAIGSDEEMEVLRNFLLSLVPKLAKFDIRVIFESDFAPQELAKFIATYPATVFGINYDIGNSAALGFNVDEEFGCYGDRITNVHVKDRLLGGTTVALGEGNADFEAVFRQLSSIAYKGNLILQTARAVDNKHAVALKCYRDMVLGYMAHYGT